MVGLALAGSSAADAAADQADFLTLDRMDDRSRFGAELGVGKFADVPADELIALRLNLYGQWAPVARPYGLYGHASVGHLVLAGDDESALGGVEFGGYYRRGMGPLRFVVRAGLGLPTADDDAAGTTVLLATGWERLTDFGLGSNTSFRGSSSLVGQWGSFFSRLDAGLDVVLADNPADPFLHISLGLGLRPFEPIAVTAELVNVIVLGVEADLDDKALHAAALSIQTMGPTRFRGGVVIPLDEGIRGDLVFVALGVQVVFD